MSNQKLFITIAVVAVGLFLYFTITRKYTNSTITQAELSGTLGSLTKDGTPQVTGFWDWIWNEWNGYVDNYLKQGKLFDLKDYGIGK